MTRFGKLMSTETMLRLYKAFILPHFYYCSMVWQFSSNQDSDKLDLLNKRILRFIFKDFNSDFLIIGSRQQLLTINPCTVRVGTTDVKPVSEVRNLGSWFDSNFSMSIHISKSCSAAIFWLHNIKQISKFLASDKLEIVLHAFVTSRIDYCNGPWRRMAFVSRTYTYLLA